MGVEYILICKNDLLFKCLKKRESKKLRLFGSEAAVMLQSVKFIRWACRLTVNLR